jgi:hypothetical protein
MTDMTWIDEMIEAIQREDESAHEAALTLGLLIERERVRRPAGDGGLRMILGEKWAKRKLSEMELNHAVDRLIDYTNQTAEPHPMAVWALTKSHEVRTLDCFIGLLDRVLSDPAKEHLAYQALIGTTSFYNSRSLAAIRRAAVEGHGLVKETAVRYLQLFEKGNEDREGK